MIAPGARFGRLMVVRYLGGRRYECTCDCGVVTRVIGAELTRGRTKSCGCWRRDNAKAKRESYRHGHAAGRKTPTYLSWRAMRQRCLTPTAHAYEHYGGRGITICERWQTFTNFLADMGERPEGKTLDRINNDGNYEPGNCRWATPSEQANNRTRGSHGEQ